MSGKFAVIGIDWSGVIADDKAFAYETAKRTLARFGIAIEPTATEWLASSASTPASEHARRKEMAPSGSAIASTTVEDYVSAFGEEADLVRSSRPDLSATQIPGARLAIAKLAAVPVSRDVDGPKRFTGLFLASAAPVECLLRDVGRFGIGSLFDLGIYGDCNDKAKRIVAVLRECGARPEEAAYVGDTTGDVVAARRAGVTSVAVCGGYHSEDALRREGPDAIFSDLGEFADNYARGSR